MAKKVTKNKSGLDDSSAGPPVAASPSTTGATPKSKAGAKKVKAPAPPSPPPMDLDDLPDSPSASASASSDSGDEDENEIGNENANGAAVEWPKEDDLELIKRIRAVCPKEDHMKYDSRVNHVDWEAVKFGIYSGDDCKARWLHIQSHLRHYRILSEVLSDAVLWRTEFPWYNFNKGGKSTMKHPELPKKPLTSYMLFYMEQKNLISKENPGLGMTELSKQVAKMYNSLSEKKKQKYVQLAEEKKQEYNREMIKFMEEHPDYIPPKSAGKFAPAKAVPPKLPTPLKLFTDHYMPKFLKDGLASTDARNMCSKNYRELNEKQKMKWIYKALAAEVAYNEEMEKFKLEHPEVDISSKKVSLLTKEELQIKDKNDGKPEKPPNSGYSLYSKQLLSSGALKAFESKERMTEISRMWKELSEEEKNDYNERAQAMNHQYKMKYASYLESLTPDQRAAELHTTLAKGQKRPAAKKGDEEVAEKKSKKEDKSSNSSSEEEDEDFEAPKKPAIQKPHSSLQMFCTTNEAKYRSKFPNLPHQELTRLMAKDFAKMSSEQKKKYDSMAQKSKNESTAAVVKSPPKTTKSKGASASSNVASPPAATTSKAGPASKKAAAAAASGASTTAPTAKAAPASKKAAAKSSATVASGKAANGSPVSKTTSKASTSKASPKPAGQTVPPPWANQWTLYPGEPPKPHENVQAYYAGITLKTGNLSSKRIEEVWAKVPKKEKKKIVEEHKKKLAQYTVDFEKYLRKLGESDLKEFRAVMFERKKNSNADDDDDHSEAEDSEANEEDESEEESSSEEEDDDDEDDDDDDE